MNEIDVAWFAGIFDGEGSLSIPRHVKGDGFALRLEIFSSSPELLDKAMCVCEYLGVPTNDYHWEKPKKNALGNKPVKRLAVTGVANVLAVLEAILPHLTEKREFAAEAIRAFGGRVYRSPWTASQISAVKSVRQTFMPRSHKI